MLIRSWSRLYMVLDAHDRWHPLGFTRSCKLVCQLRRGVCVVSARTPGGPSRCEHRAHLSIENSATTCYNRCAVNLLCCQHVLPLHKRLQTLPRPSHILPGCLHRMIVYKDGKSELPEQAREVCAPRPTRFGSSFECDLCARLMNRSV